MALPYQFISQVNPPYNMPAGEVVDCSITIKNTSTTDTWPQNGSYPFRIGTARTQNHASALYPGGPTSTTGWVSSSRIQLPNDVAPGATVTIPFKVKAPSAGLVHSYFQPLKEGVEWAADIGMYMRTQSIPPIGAFVFLWQKLPIQNYGGRWKAGNYGNFTINTDLDKPNAPGITDFYASSDVDIIDAQQQIIFGDLDMDFTPLDRWFNNDSSGDPDFQYIKDNADLWIDRMAVNWPDKKFSFLMEPDMTNPNSVVQVTQAMFDELYNNYGTNPQFLKIGGKLAIYMYRNRIPGTDSGDRFYQEPMWTGNQVGYSNWWRNPADRNGRSHLNYIHRFDNTRVAAAAHYTVNPDMNDGTQLSQMVYALQQRYALASLTTIYNEYPERCNWFEVSQDARDQGAAFVKAWKTL